MKRLVLALIAISAINCAHARFYGPGSATRAYMGEGMYAAAGPTGRMSTGARAADVDDIYSGYGRTGRGRHYAGATFAMERPEHSGWGTQPMARTFHPSGHVAGYGSTGGAGYY